MKNNQLMIYGAYGYAGELMVREAVAQGLRPIIAGRDDEKLKPIATELSSNAGLSVYGIPEAIYRI